PARGLQTAWAGCAEESSGLGLHEPHALVHRIERRLAGPSGLFRADREQALQLPLVGAQLAIALLDGGEEGDDGLADGLLELAVAGTVETALELGDRLSGRDGHDLQEIRDAGLRLGVVANLLLGVR